MRSGGVSPRVPSVRDQPVARELALGLLKAHVARRQDHVGLDQLVLGDLVAVAGHDLEHLRPELAEAGLVALLHGGDGAVVQLVEAARVLVGQPELPLTGDADDHGAGFSASPCSSAGASPPPDPSSAFIFESSSSTWAPAPSCASSRSMSSWPWPSWVRSSNVPAASSSSTAEARAFICSVLSSARWIARPRSAICSPTPFAASEIFTCASAAEYCALMTSFFVRKVSIFTRSFFSLSVSCCCWRSSSCTCESSDWSSVWATVLRSSAARARSSRPCERAWRACVSSFTTCCSSLSDCIWRRFFDVVTSAMPFL